MKYFTVILMLIAMALPAIAEESLDIVQMGDFDKTFQGFSLSNGTLIDVDIEGDGLPIDIDFIFDMPNGLGMNNEDLSGWFTGKAGIIDLGPVSLEDDDTVIPAMGFNPFLEPDNIIPGHTYLIQTGNEEHYGKIQIVQFDAENELLEFTWVYLDK